MAIDVYYANSPKRRNSTKQATFSESNKYTCTLKDATSFNKPTFLFEGNWIGWNVAKWGDRYYFVEDVRAVRNGLWEVDCVMDALATYKSAITSSTQYVSYSSNASNTWLPDTRIPSVTNSLVSAVGDYTLDFIDYDGFYTLGVIGDNGCELYGVTQADLGLIIDRLNTWKNDAYTAIKFDADGQFTYDWVNSPQESQANFNMATAFMSAAWSNATNCLRSCTWVPFKRSNFQTGGAKNIKLGSLITVVNTKALSGKAVKVASISASIPWHFSDWRRITNEDAYIYLPFVGVIKLPNGDVNQCTSIRVDISANCIDGSIQYQLKGDVSGYLGNYGAKLGAEYPIGINQGHSAADVYQTRENHTKNLTNAVSSISLLNPISWGTGPVNVVSAFRQGGFDEMKMQFERTATQTGSYGASSVCSNMYNKIRIWTVSQDTIVTPSSMAATMGRPMMKPMSLSGLSGFCQCANAHVECDADATELDIIDGYLNSGFYIE